MFFAAPPFAEALSSLRGRQGYCRLTQALLLWRPAPSLARPYRAGGTHLGRRGCRRYKSGFLRRLWQQLRRANQRCTYALLKAGSTAGAARALAWANRRTNSAAFQHSNGPRTTKRQLTGVANSNSGTWPLSNAAPVSQALCKPAASCKVLLCAQQPEASASFLSPSFAAARHLPGQSGYGGCPRNKFKVLLCILQQPEARVLGLLARSRPRFETQDVLFQSSLQVLRHSLCHASL